MTFYDDAELTAVRMLRLAVEEHYLLGSESRSVAMSDVVVDIFEQHGQDGIKGLAVALARFGGNAVTYAAKLQGVTPAQWLDQWEMHKLEQHQQEQDDPED